MKAIYFLFLTAVSLILASVSAMAHCPLCTAAVGAAAISAKYYGMDSSIIGVFIGAFGISTGIWISRKVKHYIKLQTPLIVIASFLLTVVPLYKIDNDYLYLPMLLIGSAGSLLNKVYWLNKIIFGSILGGIVSWFAYGVHILIKKVNGNVLFPFQGVIITLLSLIILIIPMYFLVR